MTTFCGGLGSRWAERRMSIRGEQGAQVEDGVAVGAGRPGDRSPGPADPRVPRHLREAAGGREVGARLLHEPVPPHDRGRVDRRPWAVRSTDLDGLHHVNNAATWEPIEDELVAPQPRRHARRDRVRRRHRAGRRGRAGGRCRVVPEPVPRLADRRCEHPGIGRRDRAQRTARGSRPDDPPGAYTRRSSNPRTSATCPRRRRNPRPDGPARAFDVADLYRGPVAPVATAADDVAARREAAPGLLLDRQPRDHQPALRHRVQRRARRSRSRSATARAGSTLPSGAELLQLRPAAAADLRRTPASACSSAARGAARRPARC